MARTITIFELHFDGARFGPIFGSEESADDEASETMTDADEFTSESGEGMTDADAMTEETADEGSASRARTALAVIAAVAVTSLLGRTMIRRRRGSRDLEKAEPVAMVDDGMAEEAAVDGQ